MVFEHQASRPSPDEQMSRDEYVDLMKLLRPKASDRLGVRMDPISGNNYAHLSL